MNKLLLDVYKNYEIYYHLERIKKIKNREIIFLCVGNSKIWFDSFGPIVGSVLKYMNLNKFIYGNTKFHITSENINDYVNAIYSFHNNPYIVVFDSALSKTEIPILKIKEGQTKCASFSNNPVNVGDLSITYCFNEKHLKVNENYDGMIRDIKKLTRLIYFLFYPN